MLLIKYLLCLLFVFFAPSLWAQGAVQKIEERFVKQFSLLFPEGELGLEVYSKQKDSVLHSINANKAFRPASTLKVLVTSAALDTLAPSKMFESKVELRGTKYGKTFWGNVILDPMGNPGFTGRFFDHPAKALEPIAKNLKALGIDTLWGEIKINESTFGGQLWPESWENKFKDRCFAALVQSAVFNENCARLVVEPGEKSGAKPVVYTEPYIGFFRFSNNAITSAGKGRNISFVMNDSTDFIQVDGSIGEKAHPFSAAVPLRNPREYFQRALSYSLMMEGIRFFPQAQKEEAPLYREFFLQTVSLEEVVHVINRRSHNLFAELLLRHLGKVYFGVANDSTGLKAVQRFLQKIGVQDSIQTLFDGSGLSYANRIQPSAMNLILRYMLKHSNRDVFLNSLNYATEPGASGTRMLGLIYPYGVRFKTGFVAETQGLAGYIFTAAGDTLAVSFLVNGYKVDDWSARKFMDSLWTQLTFEYDRERASVLELESLYHSGDSIKGIGKRLQYFSAYFLGRPYHSPPTGEGVFGKVKQEPLVNSSAFDCVTYIEHVMALTYSRDSAEIFSELQKIRYQKGKVDFHKRNHFFVEDWIGNNAELVQIDTLWTDLVGVQKSDKRKFAGFFKLEYKEENPQTTLRYHSLTKIDSLFANPWKGEEKVFGVGLVGDLDWLWVTHTGFLILKPGQKPLFRHASSKAKEVSEAPLSDYLATRKNLRGVVLFDFLEPHD